jgi:cobalt-zinc-cadmium efflux system protein
MGKHKHDHDHDHDHDHTHDHTHDHKHDHDHTHDHKHGHAHSHFDAKTPEQALWIAVLLNGAFLLIEAGVGWWTNSLALLSDAGHMLSDVGSLIIALIAVRISTRKPSAAYTFGLRRAPVLGALINGISLVVIVLFIGIEAVERFQNPEPINAQAVLWTGVAGLAVNLGSAWALARSHDHSVNTRGAMLHLLSDALGSVAAIVSGIAAAFWNVPLADPIASLIIGILILASSGPLLRDTVRILLQSAPTDIDVESAKKLIAEHPGVLSVGDFHIWALDSGQPILTAAITVQSGDLLQTNTLCDALRKTLLSRFSISHATFECRHPDAPPQTESC